MKTTNSRDNVKMRYKLTNDMELKGMKRKKIKNQIITVIMLGFMTFNIVPSETIEAIAETITDEDGQKEKKSEITVTPVVADYDGKSHNLINIEGLVDGDIVSYSRDNESWTEGIPNGENAGQYTLYVKVMQGENNEYINKQVTSIINKGSLETKIKVTGYNGIFDGYDHDIVYFQGLEDGDIVTINSDNEYYVYSYGQEEMNVPQKNEVGEYPYTVQIHRNDNYVDYVMSGVTEIMPEDGNTNLLLAEEDEENNSVVAWDGVAVQEPQLIGYEYKIDSAEKLAWFAKEVNHNNNFDGKSICITGNIDLNGKEWPVIGCNGADNPSEIKGTIVIQNAVISGFNISENTVDNKGLFGAVKIWNLQIDNLTMENANITCSSGNYDGLLFGNLNIEKDGICEIRNSSIGGTISGESHCGAVAGYVFGEGDNAALNIVNCDFELESNTYGTWWDGAKDNADYKGGIIGRYYTKSNGNSLTLNGIYCNVNLAAYKEYGYGKCTVGGMVGELEGNAYVYVYQCAVDGTIVSSGYQGFAGGVIGKMVSCIIYKQSDTYVTAAITSKWNAYGYPYNAGGFIEGPIEKKPNGFIRNSYFAGVSGSTVAFIAKDCVKGENLKIYNSYFDSDVLSNKIYHTDWSCYTIDNTVVDCNAYSTRSMGIQSNFAGWDFDNVWVMGEQYPELRRCKFNLPEDFLTDINAYQDSEIVKAVREYTSQEIYSQWEEIWNSEDSNEVKFEKIIALALNYGITDPREGLEFVIKSKEKRWAYNKLISDDLYTASNFLQWSEEGGKALLWADGLIFNNEFDAWTDIGTYIESDYPGVRKYKDMLYTFMDSTSHSIEAWNNIKLVSQLSKKVTDSADLIYVKEKLKEINKIADSGNGEAGQEEILKIMEEMAAKGVFTEGKLEGTDYATYKFSYTLDESSGFGQFAKAMGLVTKTISLVDMTISDIQDMVLLDSKLQTYYQFDQFLNDIIEAKGEVPNELRAAAQQVQKEIKEGYWTNIKEIAGQCIGYAKITSTIKNSIIKKLGTEFSSISGWLKAVKITTWFINQVADIGNMTRQATYVQGYAYLTRMYKNHLENSAAKFRNSMTEQNAWEFYYNYNMLYSLRYRGEEAYLKMHDIKGLAGKLLSYGYADKKEVTDQILSMLKNDCKFDFDKDADIPESLQYLSKLIVSCPVDVKICSAEGTQIAELKDGELQDLSNEYGRFVVVYNYCTGDYQKVIYLADENVKISVIAKDDGLVNLTYGYKNNDGNTIIKNIANQPILKENNIEISPDKIQTEGKVTLASGNNVSELELRETEATHINIERAELSNDNVELGVGESKLLQLIISPNNASIKNVTWYSSEPEIAIVRDGKVSACKEGIATIYGFLHDKKEPLICKVTVCDKKDNNAKGDGTIKDDGSQKDIDFSTNNHSKLEDKIYSQQTIEEEKKLPKENSVQVGINNDEHDSYNLKAEKRVFNDEKGVSDSEAKEEILSGQDYLKENVEENIAEKDGKNNIDENQMKDDIDKKQTDLIKNAWVIGVIIAVLTLAIIVLINMKKKKN